MASASPFCKGKVQKRKCRQLSGAQLVKEASEKSTVRRKGGKKLYHDLRDAFLGVLCHNTLHIPVAHHAPHVTFLLLIPANRTPLHLAPPAAGAQAICKGTRAKQG